ncbi:hypothetical protein FR483_n296L [Paramecium bursaria Chlorella virus FR483]|uniref:Uncharacterized protein n296L n=1 Tax=Paramecium bursaria Chlorella virus FR483 TaxID=399781 RepID=A7J700_PBCVF|nr:hypothetical protein FR483_n296L [Paramecium bursaria Chlorella virus FR483]ABT15581.1 hypothetical protein FR483_n296L [Paramecium bursaria Chlorella virus FR483]
MLIARGCSMTYECTTMFSAFCKLEASWVIYFPSKGYCILVETNGSGAETETTHSGIATRSRIFPIYCLYHGLPLKLLHFAVFHVNSFSNFPVTTALCQQIQIQCTDDIFWSRCGWVGCGGFVLPFQT